MTVAEMVTVASLVSTLAGQVVRGAASGADRVAVVTAQGAVLEAYRTGRAAATALGRPSEVVVAADSIVVRSVGVADTIVLTRQPGPAASGIAVSPAVHVTTTGAGGLATGAGNVTIRLTRGSIVRQITVSRLGRVRTS